MVAALPLMARVNWRNVVMPWRMLPAPVALALIALVALAMVLDRGSDAVAQQPIPAPLSGQGVMVGADTVAPGTRCEEDEVITYRALIGGQGVGCVHYEYVVMEFLNDCIIGNSEAHALVTPNLATLHLRDPEFRSWCDGVVDDVSDGIVSLADMIVDVRTLRGYPGYIPEVTATPTATPTMTATATASPTATGATPTHAIPMALPATGGR